MRLQDVTLSVRDLDRSIVFYREAIGLELLAADAAGSATLGLAGQPALRLVESATARPRDRAAAGLFHVAWLLRDRASLGAALLRLEARSVRLTGAADHHVSEAVYLDDPDGNGIELYADRPPGTWRRNGELVLVNDRLDLAGLVAAARTAGVAPEASAQGARLGHVHLEAVDLAASSRFGRNALGLELQAAWSHAHFLGWDGYHHHLAWNDWNGRRLAADVDALGLVEIGIAGVVDPGARLVDPNGIVFAGRAAAAQQP